MDKINHINLLIGVELPQNKKKEVNKNKKINQMKEIEAGLKMKSILG